MKILKTIIIILVIILVCGFSFTLIKGIPQKNEDKDKTPSSDITDSGNTDVDNTDKDEDDKPPENEEPPQEDVPPSEEEPYVFLGKEGFKSDFNSETMSVVVSGNNRYQLEDGVIYPTQIYCEEGYGEITLDGGRLNYICTQSASLNTYPSFKLKPLEFDTGKIRLAEFEVLTADFDIEFDVDKESEYYVSYRALFNVRSDTTGSTVCSQSDYYYFDGSGHYTFIFVNTGNLDTMRIFIYKDGIYKTAVSDFIYDTEYLPYDLYVSCLNIGLPRTAGDTVSVDNVAFYYFDNGYDGELTDLLSNPDVDLSTLKDAKGFNER